MILDGHIHIWYKEVMQEEFVRKLNQAGVRGGVVISTPPLAFDNKTLLDKNYIDRILQLKKVTDGADNLFPFFFLDPWEKDVYEQIDYAIDKNICGFKIICNNFYPQDDYVMKIWEYIAERNKPILFHSGILYNESPSAEYNRPSNFEHLFYLTNLRFSLAHISWPWCDECIAVFGKWDFFHRSKKRNDMAELYIDISPGTPTIYREEVLRKLLTIDYPIIKNRIIFGTDGNLNYKKEKHIELIDIDKSLYRKIGVPKAVEDNIFSNNLLSFLHGNEESA